MTPSPKDLADSLEQEMTWTQLSPYARNILRNEVVRLRDVAAIADARNGLVRDVANAARVVSITPQPMPLIDFCSVCHLDGGRHGPTCPSHEPEGEASE